jgi:hypothetical protein
MIAFVFLFVCSVQQMLIFSPLFVQSRARCDPTLGSSPHSRCVKLKDRMLRTKDGPVWATARAPPRGTSCVGALSSYWRGERSPNCFQAVPNGTCYLDPPEERE